MFSVKGEMLLDSLVFTDLDGTLLNHNDYSFKEALPALNYLKQHNIPLIIATSKTFNEVRLLQKQLEIQCPFIVENGAGIFVAADSVLAQNMPKQNRYIKISHAKSYLELRLFFQTLQKKYPIKGFGDMTVEEVMQHTSLTKENALNAMKRDFTEPFIATGEINIEAMKQEAHKEGLDIVQGGRFYHLISQGHDKASAMKYLTHLYEEKFFRLFKMIALGDSANDFTMLQAADIGVLMQQYDGSYANVNSDTIIKSHLAGAKGWNKALLEVFNVQ